MLEYWGGIPFFQHSNIPFFNMRLLFTIFLSASFALPFCSFGQNISGIINAVTQDTAKPKTGVSSNLAVSDSGATSKGETKKVKNPLKQMKKGLAESAIGNNPGGMTGNLAVGDEGAPADKKEKKKTKKKD